MRGDVPHRGSLEVICGPMFSGKTEELIRRLRRCQIARQKVVILKPGLDDRYDTDHLVSHSQVKIPSICVKTPRDVLEHGRDAEVVGIDEVQFLEEGIVAVCETLANEGRRVIAAGESHDVVTGASANPRPRETLP